MRVYTQSMNHWHGRLPDAAVEVDYAERFGRGGMHVEISVDVYAEPLVIHHQLAEAGHVQH